MNIGKNHRSKDNLIIVIVIWGVDRNRPLDYFGVIFIYERAGIIGRRSFTIGCQNKKGGMMWFSKFMNPRAEMLERAGFAGEVIKAREEIKAVYGDGITRIEVRDAALIILADLSRRIEKLEGLLVKPKKGKES